MLKIPGCPTAPGHILQHVSQHAFTGCSDPQSSAQQRIHHIGRADEEAQTDNIVLAVFQIAHFFFLLQILTLLTVTDVQARGSR